MEETNVIPRELHGDRAGMNRIDRIRFADGLVARSRFIADGETNDRVLSEFGLETYCGWLTTAAREYRSAGLGLLADRVDEFLANPSANAWAAFDQANATEEL